MAGRRWLTRREERAWRALQFMQMRLESELARQLAADSRLSYPEYLVLVALTDSTEGSMRLFEVAGVLRWEKSRLSHQVARMVERGLISKQRSEADHRGTEVSITELGRREIAAAAPGHVAAVRRLFIDRLTTQQLDAITDIAESVLASLDDLRPR